MGNKQLELLKDKQFNIRLNSDYQMNCAIFVDNNLKTMFLSNDGNDNNARYSLINVELIDDMFNNLLSKNLPILSIQKILSK